MTRGEENLGDTMKFYAKMAEEEVYGKRPEDQEGDLDKVDCQCTGSTIRSWIILNNEDFSKAHHLTKLT